MAAHFAFFFIFFFCDASIAAIFINVCPLCFLSFVCCDATCSIVVIYFNGCPLCFLFLFSFFLCWYCDHPLQKLYALLSVSVV